MSLGAKGVISVLSHVIPAETHQMAQYCLDNNFAAAMKMQIEYLDLINDLFIEVNPIPVKEAMNMMGMEVGGLRAPLTGLEKEHEGLLENALKGMGLLK